jgi:N-methylhydantoinase B/oxoprolinase/acetone carboxylase alpha subunit
MISLQHHGLHEAHKQLHLRMQRNGLTSVKVLVTRRAGKLRFNFSGTDAEVKKAEKILADWN